LLVIFKQICWNEPFRLRGKAYPSDILSAVLERTAVLSVHLLPLSDVNKLIRT